MWTRYRGLFAMKVFHWSLRIAPLDYWRDFLDYVKEVAELGLRELEN